MKFIKYIFVAIACSFLTFCTSNTILKKPDNLISKKEMADVLTDMLLATGGKNIKNLNLERKVNYYPLVFEKHQIDSLQFQTSSAFYISRIDDYNDILKDVNQRLSKKKDELSAMQEVEDSLKAIEKGLKKNKLQAPETNSLLIKSKDSVLKKELNKSFIEQ